MENSDNVRFRLVSIENEEMKLWFNRLAPDDLNDRNLKFHYKIGTVIKLSEDSVVVVPSVRYTCMDNVILESSAEFVYSIQSLSAAMDVDRENKRILVKSNIFPSLLSSSFSTLRGMVHARMKDTPLAGFPVPIVGVDMLMRKNGISVI